MTYVKIDDRFPEHPKVMDIGPLAEALWLRALCYAGRNTTDGFVPLGFVRRMADLDGITEAERLCCAGLWDAVDGGFVFHDYTDWQTSKERIQEISRKRAAAGHKGGKQKASNLLGVSSGLLGHGSSKSYPEAETETETEERRQQQPYRAPAHEPPPLPIYVETLDGALPKLESLFQDVDKQFSPSWLAKELDAAAAVVGPLTRKQLGEGLSLALNQLKRQMDAGKVSSPRPFAHRLIVDYLTEQRDDHHAA